MNTPEEIKKALLHCDKEGDSPECRLCPLMREEGCMDILVRDALTLIQQLEAQVGKDKNVPSWISVDERLPEDDVNVLVYAIGNNEDDVIAMTSYTHNMHCFGIEGWRSPWQYFFYNYKITHWMPLPEGPKEEST